MEQKYKSREKLIRKILNGNGVMQNWYSDMKNKYGSKFTGWGFGTAGPITLTNSTPETILVSYSRNIFFMNV